MRKCITKPNCRILVKDLLMSILLISAVLRHLLLYLFYKDGVTGSNPVSSSTKGTVYMAVPFCVANLFEVGAGVEVGFQGRVQLLLERT